MEAVSDDDSKDDEVDHARERLGSPMQIFVGGECVYDPDEDKDEDAPPAKKTGTGDAAPAHALAERYRR